MTDFQADALIQGDEHEIEVIFTAYSLEEGEGGRIPWYNLEYGDTLFWLNRGKTTIFTVWRAIGPAQTVSFERVEG